jgi:hypothetical protein
LRDQRARGVVRGGHVEDVFPDEVHAGWSGLSIAGLRPAFAP